MAAACGGDDDGNDDWKNKNSYKRSGTCKGTSLEYIDLSHDNKNDEALEEENPHSSSRRRLKKEPTVKDYIDDEAEVVGCTRSYKRKKTSEVQWPVIIGPENQQLRSNRVLHVEPENISRFQTLISENSKNLEPENKTRFQTPISKNSKNQGRRRPLKNKAQSVKIYIDDEAEVVGAGTYLTSDSDESDDDKSSIKKPKK